MPERVITKPPSAELKPNQTDQDSLPPYDVLDDILECLVEQDLSVEDIVQRGHSRNWWRGSGACSTARNTSAAKHRRASSCPGARSDGIAVTRSPTGWVPFDNAGDSGKVAGLWRMLCRASDGEEPLLQRESSSKAPVKRDVMQETPGLWMPRVVMQ